MPPRNVIRGATPLVLAGLAVSSACGRLGFEAGPAGALDAAGGAADATPGACASFGPWSAPVPFTGIVGGADPSLRDDQLELWITHGNPFFQLASTRRSSVGDAAGLQAKAAGLQTKAACRNARRTNPEACPESDPARRLKRASRRQSNIALMQSSTQWSSSIARPPPPRPSSS